MKENNIRILKEQKSKSRIPHFGPLKGAAKWQKQAQGYQSQPHYQNIVTSTHPFPNAKITGSINKER